MKILYIILLLTFGFGQDCSLNFDGENDYVESNANPIFNSSQASIYLQFSTTDNSADSDGDLHAIFSTYGSNSLIEIGTKDGYLGYWSKIVDRRNH